MRQTGYVLISVGCLLAALGACSSEPATNGTSSDGPVATTDTGPSTSSTSVGTSSTTSATSTNATASSTETSGGGSGGTGSPDASSVTQASAAVTTGMGGATTDGSASTGLAAGGTGTQNTGAEGGTTATTTGDTSTSAAGGTSGAGGTGVTIPDGCNVSTPVSFENDIQPFLGVSCGKGVDSGCHVTDSQSTMGSMCPDGSNNCGFTHAYDWITAGAHASSCPETPTPKRFEVVLDVIAQGNPSSCSQSRIMPPPGMGTPLTECEIAALAAWLAEPRVLQTHRADDSSPEEPYEMPPFN